MDRISSDLSSEMDHVYPHSRPYVADGPDYGSRTSVSELPSLPDMGIGREDEDEGVLNDTRDDTETSHNFVEFDMSGMEEDNRNHRRPRSPQTVQRTWDTLERGSDADVNAKGIKEDHSRLELGGFDLHYDWDLSAGDAEGGKIGTKNMANATLHNELNGPQYQSGQAVSEPHPDPSSSERLAPDQTDKVVLDPSVPDDFFASTGWKQMKTVTDTDYYDERGALEFQALDKFNQFNPGAGSRGYTKIDTEEQVAKYAELDKKTDFLFRPLEHRPANVAAYRKEDVDLDLEYDGEDVVDSNDQLRATKDMLSDAQRFAYLGIARLIMTDMATDMAQIKQTASYNIGRELSNAQKNFSNWTLYISGKLYDHIELLKEERTMIENLALHGLEVQDLLRSLMENEMEGDTTGATSVSPKFPGFDLRWALVCDLFLVLISDGYYDSRSRSLMLKFAGYLGIRELEVLQFERRLIDSLELETHGKSIETNDEKLADREFIERHEKRNRKKRMAYIGLATLGGSLAIGLSAGLLAPVIGAGVAAGLTTVGISGTGSFLAGVGGSVIISTGGVVTGASIGHKAGSRRLGEVQTFELKPLHNNRRTNLIITVSGWMNGKADDVRLPFSTVDPVMGDMFSLLWEPEMLQSMGQTIGILASEALSTSIQQILGATILTTLMAAIQLPMAISKLSYLLDNPWNVSLDRAWKAGKIMADTLISGNMGVRPITLVGFSLGARLIYSCLIELAKRGVFGLVENVILLGSPIAVKTDHMALVRTVVSGRFINGYSKNDWILGYLFRATSGGLSSVAGLLPIDNVFGVENIDCSELVEGHMAYRTAIPKILKKLEWEVLSEEFAEIEEPDPEQGERTRKLLSEFDEAKAKMDEEIQKKEGRGGSGWRSWFKPKEKDWWTEAGAAATANKETGHEEYTENVERAEGGKGERDGSGQSSSPDSAVPIFDVSALMDEVNKIESISEDPSKVEQARRDVDRGPKTVVMNEDTEIEPKEETLAKIKRGIGLGR